MNRLQLQCLNEQVWRVMTAQGEHVGNLKHIGLVWKFKAIGYDEQGAVLPGGGPLTHRHNTVLATPDETELNRLLGAS